MKHIWSPWRMEFITGKKKPGCVFCKKGKNEFILFRGIKCYVIMNRYPYNNGHLMVIPYKHTAEIDRLDPETQYEMIYLTGESIKILKKALKCEGVNCGMNIGRAAGAGIKDHVHMHIVPRWQGDSNFMPILSETKSMPEYLKATLKRLKPHFDKL